MTESRVRSLTLRAIFADEVGRLHAQLGTHHWLGHRLTGQARRCVT